MKLSRENFLAYLKRGYTINQVSSKWLVGIFILSFVLIIMQRTDVLLAPQLWAEDGAHWFASAYNLGILSSLFSPHTGYLQTFSRSIASLAQFIPLVYVPLFFNISAITLKIIPLLFIWSGRLRHVFSNIYSLLFVSVIYLTLPNTFEVFANVTNGHWYLSLLLFLVIIAKPAKHVLGHVYDAAIIVLASLSGPFVLFLLPISAIYYYKHRTKRLLYILLGVALFSFIQGILIVSLSEQDRIQTELGASLMLLIQIISGQVFTASLIGQSGYGRVYEAFLKEPNIFATIFSIVTFLIGMATLAYTSIKAQLEIKLFLLFGVFVSAASLYSPMISRTSTQWPIMVLPGAGTRYWFLPMLAFVMSLVFLIKKQNPIYARVIGAMLFVVLLYGMKADFHKPHFEPRDYAAHVETFEALPIGEAYKIPIYPVGWDMVLIKK